MAHRIGGRKLSRKQGPRLALFKNLTVSVLRYERVKTTEAKAKEISGQVEKVITLAKRGDLSARRAVVAQFPNEPLVVNKLFDEIADGIEELVDEIAERLVQLGGTAEGTIGAVKQRSSLGEYPLAIAEGRAHLDALRERPPSLPVWLTGLPLVGGWIAELPRYLEPGAIEEWLRDNVRLVQDLLLQTAGRVGRNVLKTGVALLALFFFLRDGDEIVRQIRAAARNLGGETVERRLEAVGGTVRAVVFGLLVTAAVQGVLAGVGYAVAGVPAPVLLGIVTGVLAVVPYGTAVVFVPASLWLLFQGEPVAGVGLLLWGMLVVASMDNLLRPLFISGAIRVPYLLVLFGVLGGLGAFGLVGVFAGPVLLSALFALWREWAAEGDRPS